MVRWDQRFFESTRGQVAALLRRRGRTVEELAGELGLTHNGVRAHLATLGRDGIVRQRGVVRRREGGGKPAYVYELTPEAEALFSRAYKPVLRGLLEVLFEQLGSGETEVLLRAAGRRLAEEWGAPPDGGRPEVAVAALNELGGLAELEECAGGFVIRGYSCPLAAAVADHPEVCRMVGTLLRELAGVEIRERCDNGERPRCRFEAKSPDGRVSPEPNPAITDGS